jgi:hypothetical protein
MARTPSTSRFYVLLVQIPSPCSRDTGDTRTLGPDHIWMRRRLYNAAWIVYFLVRDRSQKHEWLNTQIFVSYRFFFLSHPPRRLTFLPKSRWIVLSHYLPTSQCQLHWLTEKKKRGGGGEAWLKCENLGQCTSSCKRPARIVISKRNWIPNHTPRALLPAITSSFASCFRLRYWQQLYLSTPFFFLIFSCCCCYYCCPTWSLEHPLYQATSSQPSMFSFVLLSVQHNSKQ